MREVHVAAGILYRDNALLAARRAPGTFEGLWEFPGGKVEVGETAEEALRREIREELACSLSTVWHYDTITHTYDDFTVVMDCFICMLAPDEEPKPQVHDELRWLSREELLDVAWLEADVALVQGLGTWWDTIFSPAHL